MISGLFKMLPINYLLTNHLTGYKQMTNVKLYCLCYLEILEIM